MFHRDPILIRAPLGRIYSFTRYYRGDNFFDGPRLAFPHDRGYARERLLELTRHLGDDPFCYRLLDVWQLVFQKPWTRPASLHQLVMDLTDKITRGELFVYLEPNLERDYRALIPDGPSADSAGPNDNALSADIPRVAGQRAIKSTGWASDYASGLGGTVSAMASDFASEQTDLYDNSSGWGNVMYPVFKPIENAGRFMGNTVGLLSGLSPKGMNPDVAEYWRSMGEGFQALGNRVADAVKGDGRAAGEVTPILASLVLSKNLPDKLSDLYAKAPAAKLEIDAMADEIAEMLNGKVAKAPIKSLERAAQKIMDDYNGDPTKIKDLARNTIIVSPDDVDAAAAELAKRGATVKIVNGETDPLGYSGVNSKIKTQAGIFGEIQVNTPQMIYAKEPESVARALLGDDLYSSMASRTKVPGGQGHRLYEEWRVLDPSSSAAQSISERSRAYYESVRKANAHK